MESIDCLVIGAGVIGLAVGRKMALAGHSVIIAEATGAIGSETSSRNSGVIHAGIYYPQGSLKAQLCVSGRDLLYAYCAERGIPHRKTGKLIVATEDSEIQKLNDIRATALANGVSDLEMIDASALSKMEPELRACAALFSPSTGIIDPHVYMLNLQGDVENCGGVIALHTQVESIRTTKDGFIVHLGDMDLACRLVINCAGLDALTLARKIEGFPETALPRSFMAKGSYFSLSGRTPFKHLVYPVPEPGGLGCHLTLDLAGRGRFGPDVEWVETRDYDVDISRIEKFEKSIRRYWPGLPDNALQPAYSGIRPKIAGPGEPFGDFIIQTPKDHGLPGLINLFGIESPGLTASLAIAETVLSRIE